LNSLAFEVEVKKVKDTINLWYKAATEMNLDLFMELVGDEFVLLNPGR
jgi:hypothetical protein